MKDNFKIVDKHITEENNNSHFKYEFIQYKIESHLTNFNTYDLETHNTDRARLYVFCFYWLSKLAGRSNPDLTPYEYEKCKIDTNLFIGDDCITRALDFRSKFKKE